MDYEKKSILLVDDEPTIRKFLKPALEQIGYKITAVGEPLTALKLLQKDSFQYDLLLTDYRLPQMNGIDLANKSTEVRPNLPVVLLSGYLDEEVERTASQSGITTILHKPIWISTLSAILKCKLGIFEEQMLATGPE